MIIYRPYVYLIGWSKLDRWYYGVEYKNNKRRKANPSNLWTTYFTSSKVIERFRAENGEPDIIQIRKTFSDRESARDWEEKVLIRMKVVLNERWLNGHDFRTHFHFNTVRITDGINETHILKGETIPAGWYRGLSDESKKRNAKSISELITITNGPEERRIHRDSIIPEGWRRGRKETFKISPDAFKNSPTNKKGYKHSEEHRRKNSLSKSGVKRGPHSEEHRNKIAESNRGQKRSKEFCENMSKIKKGIKPSYETREKNRIASTGRKLTDEAKAKISLANSGKRHTEETKRRISEMQQKPYSFISPEGNIYQGSSCNKFAAENGLSLQQMARVNRGAAKQHKGWRRYDPNLQTFS